MRVLLIDVNCKYSSTGKIVYDLYTQLNADGHTAAVCYGRGPITQGDNLFRFAPQWEVYFHALLTRVTGKTGCYSPIATKRLLRFIDKFQPDVIHLHELHGYYVNITSLINYLKNKKIKTILTLHSEFMYTGKCGYAYECDRWKYSCGNCPQLHDYPKVLWRDCTASMLAEKKEWFKGFDNLKIATPSGWLKDRVKASFLGEKKISVVTNGIDCSIFCPKDVSALRGKHHLTDEKIILAVAPDIMNERKGGRYVLKLAEQMKNNNVKFILIGIDDLSEKFPENIIPLGRIADQQELARYYSLADLFVLCSKRETFSLTCAESLCCGTPVVGFVSGAPETIAIPAYSCFVEYGNVDMLSKKCRDFLDKVWDSEQLASESKNRYSKQKMYEEYSKIMFSE